MVTKNKQYVEKLWPQFRRDILVKLQNKVHVQHQRKATTSTNIKSWYELIYWNLVSGQHEQEMIYEYIRTERIECKHVYVVYIVFNILLINIGWLWCVIYTRQENAELHFMELSSLIQQFSCRHVIPLFDTTVLL